MIMPTNGGKSLLFLLPALYKINGTTIIIIPLISLYIDLIQRYHELSISYRVWNTHQSVNRAKIVFITPKGAITSTFTDFLNQLHMIHQLDQIMLNEYHLILDHSSFHTAFDQLY